MIIEQWIRRLLGRYSHRSIYSVFRYIASGLRETRKTCQNSRSPGWNSNRTLFEYKSETSVILITCSPLCVIPAIAGVWCLCYTSRNKGIKSKCCIEKPGQREISEPLCLPTAVHTIHWNSAPVTDRKKVTSSETSGLLSLSSNFEFFLVETDHE
jgi:hypothetical protein